LDKRFVQLTLLLDQGEETQRPRWQASEQYQNLHEVLDQVPDPAIVVLGPPGSGKSILLRHYELDSAQAALEALNSGADAGGLPLTFFLPLNSYKPARSGDPLPLPKDWLAERWKGMGFELPLLDDLLRERRLILLLDALNEVPAARAEAIHLWKDFLGELARDYPGNRVIFSCRSLDYSAPLSSKDLRVPQVRIEPLSDEQVQHFLEAYCPKYSAILWKNLKGTPQLELLRSPYFLKLLVEQTQAGEVPEGRAALFTGFVRQALKREVEGDNPLFQPGELLYDRDIQRLNLARSWRTPFDLPERGVLIPKLSHLAYQMQSQRSAGEGGQVRVDYDEALGLLDHARSEDILNAGVALGVLEQDLGREEVLYVHQLLQEYFAARELAKAPQSKLVHQEWQADQVTPSLEDTLAKLADSDLLPPLPGTGWEEATVLAAAMAPNPDRFIADLMENNLPLAGRCAAQPDAKVSDGLKDKLRWALVERTQDAKADLRARIAAGLVLGELGDPRFECRKGPWGHYLLPPLIEIPEGTYTIGSDEGLYEDEAPAHQAKLQPFRIAKFPVTNAEWALFIKAGGYEDERWWDTEEAQAWRRGESKAEGPKQIWREHRKRLQDNYDRLEKFKRFTSEDIKRYRRYADMSDDDFEALLEKWHPPGRQTQPALWNDDAYNSSAQPVVGVCWHEARAYCAWLSAQTGQHFRLPTEAEWEATARGKQGRRYAYGDDFDATHCNTSKTRIAVPRR
jgi:formylglycine-generating enzyme required for sulfatase activity